TSEMSAIYEISFQSSCVPGFVPIFRFKPIHARRRNSHEQHGLVSRDGNDSRLFQRYCYEQRHLTIEAGTTVRLTNGISISALAGCTIDIEGTATAPVLLLPMVGNNAWGTINASGNNSYLTLRHAEVAYGGINLGSQATG